MGSTQEDFAVLLEAFGRSDWQEMVVEIGGDRIAVSRRDAGSPTVTAKPLPAGDAMARPDVAATPATPEPATVVAPPAPPPPAERPVVPITGSPVTGRPVTGSPVASPSVGIFWRAPSPTSAPFVEVGDTVGPDDTIGIVEVMKLMQQVPAGIAGRVSSIEVANGETVEYGQALVHVEPSG